MEENVLGFIGIGNMGQPMARRLIDAGRRLVVHDLDPRNTEPLARLGATVAGSVAEVADAAGTVFLSLPAPRMVQEVVGDLAGGAAVRQVVDFSTIGPAAGAAAAATLVAKGITYIDAPVSGGVPGARAGTLAVMVSCSKPVFESVQGLLGTFGKLFHVGELAGQAQTMKLVNNLLSATAIAISSEAMAMGVKSGLDPRVMLDIINAGSGRNSATQDKFPRAILPGSFDYGFGTGLAYKDVRLCIDEAEQLGVPMVVGAAVRQMLAITQSLHGAASDYTSLCRVVETWAGVEVRG
ncbi:NAD(P)-dependent oxidoreductase [Bordetella petrii]|uniref:NAD(P)-dependent oxidoreductase n=1 Tax=Bordetella petrii TaxID=94624 RepID=UPI001E65DEFA|nr:NAD(P)-dependent oxidoreductase [Bordetella petrii]MCD0505769.1 NAD(P)-dependent oxidoreductase [Bordetella petrii]